MNGPLTLYDCATAPSPRRARILLAEKGVAHHTVQVWPHAVRRIFLDGVASSTLLLVQVLTRDVLRRGVSGQHDGG